MKEARLASDGRTPAIRLEQATTAARRNAGTEEIIASVGRTPATRREPTASRAARAAGARAEENN